MEIHGKLSVNRYLQKLLLSITGRLTEGPNTHLTADISVHSRWLKLESL